MFILILLKMCSFWHFENTQNEKFVILNFLWKFLTCFQKRAFKNKKENAFSLIWKIENRKRLENVKENIPLIFFATSSLVIGGLLERLTPIFQSLTTNFHKYSD